MPDEEPLLEAVFPLPGSYQLPIVIGIPVVLARLNPALGSAAVVFFFFFCEGEMFIK